MSVYSGKNVSDAIQEGFKQLHIKPSDAKINIIQTGRRGFLGIGRRKAKVEVRRKQVLKKKPVNERRKPRSSSRQPHSRSSRRFTIKQRKPQPIHLKRQFKIKHEGYRQVHRTNHPSRQQQNRIAVKKLEVYLGKIVRLLGIDATMKATFQTARQVRINFDTDKEGLLIGKHGLTINALQSLSEIFLDRLGIYHLYVELDTADYRKRRMDILGRLAKKTAREAVATGKPVYLDPMPSFERKKIHRTLEDSSHVMTYSAGREPYRAVVVAPK